MALVVAGAGAGGPSQRGHLCALKVGQTHLLVTDDGHGHCLWGLRRVARNTFVQHTLAHSHPWFVSCAELAHICRSCPLRPEIMPGSIRIVIMALVVAGAGAGGPSQQGHLCALKVGQTHLLVTDDGHGHFLWELRRWYYRDAMAPPGTKLYHRIRQEPGGGGGSSEQSALH